ncbi:MAG: MFS transporter [Atopobiaceae bacterium]|nr:MFS transporter [Atopobiaceae bacterium]
MAKKKIVRIVVAILAVISAFVTLASFGASLPPSPFVPVALEEPIAADTDGTTTAVAHHQSRRLLILDENNELRRIVNFDALNSPIDAVTDVCVSEDSIYVLGVRYSADSDIIVQERVIRYNLDGSGGDVVFQTDEGEEVARSIVSIGDHRGGVVVAKLNKARTVIDFLHINGTTDGDYYKLVSQPVDDVFDAGVAIDANEENAMFATVSMRGIINDTLASASGGRDGSGEPGGSDGRDDPADLDERVFVAIDVNDDGDLIGADDVTGAIYRIGDDGVYKLAEGKNFDNLHVNGDHIVACDFDSNTVCIYKMDGTQLHSLNEVNLSTPVAAYIALAWSCRFFLIALLLWGVVRAAHNVATGNAQGVGALFASTAVVVAVSIAIGYASYDSYRRSAETRSNEISTFADYFVSIAPTLSEDFEKFDDRRKLRGTEEQINEIIPALEDVDDRVGSLCDAATFNNIGTYFTVYAKDSKGVYLLYESAMEHVLGTASVSPDARDAIEEAFKTIDDTAMHYGKSLRDETQFRLVSIPSTDGKSVVGVIEIGSRSKSFEAAVRDSLVEHVVTLLVILLVVYISYVEIRECGSCLLKYRDLERENARDAIAVLTRPFSFLVTTLASIDAVMSTLIAKALLQGTPLASNGMMLALPSIMLGLGMAVGHAIYGGLGPRVELRKLMANGAGVMTVGALCATAAVGMQGFWLYCAAKLAMAIPFGLLYTLEYSLPRRAETPKIRALAAGGIKRTDTSAAAFGTVLGAYAAQNLGNAWVYVVMACTSIIVLIMALRLFPANGKPLEKERDRSVDTRELYKRFLLSRETLATALLLMFPAIIAAGYNSFLFPLYSSYLGLSTSTINNVYVLGQLVVFVCIVPLESIESRYGRWRVSVGSLVLLTLTFLMFSFNKTVGWAVAAIALVGLFKKASDGWKPIWLAVAHERKLPAGKATGAMFATSSIELVVRPVLLGALVSEGSGTSSLVLGGICGICAVLYVLVTRGTVVSRV